MSENGRRDDAKGVTIQKITSILSRAEVHRAANRLSFQVTLPCGRRCHPAGAAMAAAMALRPAAGPIL
jgi:hypothetical protein